MNIIWDAAASSGNPVIDWLTNTGAIGILAFVIVAFMKRWIVTGSELEQVRKERDRALDILLEMTQVSAKSLDIAERKR